MYYSDKKADLPSRLPTISRKAVVITLLLFLFLSLSFTEAKVKAGNSADFQQIIQIEDIPVTRQKMEEPPKPKPRLAEVMEAQDEEVPDTFTIAETDIDITMEIPDFVDDEDVVIGIYDVEDLPVLTYQAPVKYPDLARKAGVEGIVMVEVVIGKEGKIISAEVVDVRPNGVKGFFEDTALEAAWNFQFTPGLQRGKAVKVRKRIPFEFKLNK